MNTSSKFLKALKIALMITLFINIAGFGTMYLWNWLVPVMFKGPVITFAQALGILVLSKLLFGRFGRGGGFGYGRRWQRRMQHKLAHMTPEEREQFFQKMQSHCGNNYHERKTAAAE